MIQQPYSLHTLSHAYCQNLMCRFWGDNETNLRIPRANIGETNNINYQKQSTLNSQSGIGAISIANINGVILNTGSRTKEEYVYFVQSLHVSQLAPIHAARFHLKFIITSHHELWLTNIIDFLIMNIEVLSIQ